VGKKGGDLVRVKRQKSQLELAFGAEVIPDPDDQNSCMRTGLERVHQGPSVPLNGIWY
jgi:hypothetical protein